MTEPLISVVIDTFNYGRFIEEAINSVLSQDFPLNKVQILVVDDGSTDDTSVRVKKYGPRVEYFRKPNGGQASALNYGIERARGEIIALLDADDYFLPHKLTCIAEAFNKDPAIGMTYDHLQEWHVETGERRAWPSFNAVSGDVCARPDLFLSYLPQPTSAICFRRACLKPLLPIPEQILMLADCYLVALIPFLAPVHAIPEFLGVYRIHGKNSYFVDEQQQAASARRERLQTWKVVIDAMRKWLANNGYTRKQPPVRDFLNLWTRHQQMSRFQASRPGRFRFFRYVLWENYANSSRQTWRFTALNYLTALSALAFGYEKAPAMEEWRARIRRTVESPYRALLGARSNRGSTGKEEGDSRLRP